MNISWPTNLSFRWATFRLLSFFHCYRDCNMQWAFRGWSILQTFFFKDCWCKGRSPVGGHGNPLQYSCLEKSMDRGACQPAVHGVTKSQTWLSTLTHLSSRAFSFSSLSRFLKMFFIKLSKFPFKPSLLKVLIMHGCWTLTFFKNLLNCMIFILQPIDDEFNWFLNVKPVFHTWNKYHLIVVSNSFYTVLDWIC